MQLNDYGPLNPPQMPKYLENVPLQPQHKGEVFKGHRRANI